jgi:CubicO group peptidase (beta-lactamase class C family)
MYNTGSDVLDVLIARASGQPLETFLHERIFEPLGMRDTAFSVPEASLDRFVTSYWNDPARGKPVVYDPARGGQWNHPPAFPSGAGGLAATLLHDTPLQVYVTTASRLERDGPLGPIWLLLSNGRQESGMTRQAWIQR